MAEPELLASPDDVKNAERTLDGFDTIDTSPEPGDEDQQQKKPKRKGGKGGSVRKRRAQQ